jgi:hypothetical protein
MRDVSAAGAPFEAEMRNTPSSVPALYCSSTMGLEWPWQTSGFWYTGGGLAIFLLRRAGRNAAGAGVRAVRLAAAKQRLSPRWAEQQKK